MPILGKASSEAPSGLKFRSVSTSVSALPGEFVYVDATAAAVTVTLPTTPIANTQVGVKKADNGPNFVTVVTPGTELIDGHDDAQIVRQYAGAVFAFNGTHWAVLNPTMATAGQEPPSPAWTTVTLANSWINVTGAGIPPASYYLFNQRVYLRGVISGGAGATVAFTLPIGFRPEFTVYSIVQFFNGSTVNAVASVEVQATGSVKINISATGSANVTLDSINFRVVT